MKRIVLAVAIGVNLFAPSARAGDTGRQVLERAVEKTVDALGATRKWLGKYWLTCRFRYFSRLGDRGGFHFALGMYGNWCGPDRSSGDPLDGYDGCCREHDLCYGTNRCSAMDLACTKRCDGCDDRFWSCVAAARSGDPSRFGAGKRYLYPCRDCRTGDRKASSARRYRCNQACRAGMFKMKRGERCFGQAPCGAGLVCQKARCRTPPQP